MGSYVFLPSPLGHFHLGLTTDRWVQWATWFANEGLYAGPKRVAGIFEVPNKTSAKLFQTVLARKTRSYSSDVKVPHVLESGLDKRIDNARYVLAGASKHGDPTVRRRCMTRVDAQATQLQRSVENLLPAHLYCATGLTTIFSNNCGQGRAGNESATEATLAQADFTAYQSTAEGRHPRRFTRTEGYLMQRAPIFVAAAGYR